MHVRDLEPVCTVVVVGSQAHDVFLRHAWPDCQADAKDVYEDVDLNGRSKPGRLYVRRER